MICVWPMPLVFMNYDSLCVELLDWGHAAKVPILKSHCCHGGVCVLCDFNNEAAVCFVILDHGYVELINVYSSLLI